MKTVNRSFVLVSPKTPFFDHFTPLMEEPEWAKFHEPSLYLVEEDLWNEEAVIEKYMKSIALEECSQLCDKIELFPVINDVAVFLHYFEVQLGTTVNDCLNKPLNKL
jgi:hypothetical protein